MKASIQLNLFGFPSVPVTKSVTVTPFKKKNDTLVASHTHHIQVGKFKSGKKDSTNKRKKAIKKVQCCQVLGPR
jgi:hypothetical protein